MHWLIDGRSDSISDCRAAHEDRSPSATAEPRALAASQVGDAPDIVF